MWSTEAISVLFNLIVLELSKMKLSFFFQDFDILTYEILKTTEPIELKFSGITEGVNKLAVLKFQSNLISLRKNLKIWNSGKSVP